MLLLVWSHRKHMDKELVLCVYKCMCECVRVCMCLGGGGGGGGGEGNKGRT